MARVACALAWLLAATACLCSGPAGGAPVDCSAVIFDMMDCLDYVSAGGAAAAAPDEACCEGIKKVVQLSPSCLCDALRQAVGMRIDLNTTRADGLPAACKISSSVAGLKPCDAAAGPPAHSPDPVHHAPAPSKAPTPSPSPAPTSPAPAPSSPSGEGSPAPGGFPGGSAPAPSASGAFSLGLNAAGGLVVSMAAAMAAACLSGELHGVVY